MDLEMSDLFLDTQPTIAPVSGAANYQLSKSPWTHERIELLREIYLKGSCAWVAHEINRLTKSQFTRNAIIGKITRLGLERPIQALDSVLRALKEERRREREREYQNSYRRRRNGKSIRPPTYPSDGLSALFVPPVEQRKTLLQLENNSCRFPYGNPGDDDFFFCGGDVFPERPYCGIHCRIAYNGCPEPKRHGVS